MNIDRISHFLRDEGFHDFVLTEDRVYIELNPKEQRILIHFLNSWTRKLWYKDPGEDWYTYYKDETIE